MFLTLLSIHSVTMAEKKPIKLKSSAEFNQRSSLTPAIKNSTTPTSKKSTPTSSISYQPTASRTMPNTLAQTAPSYTPAPIYYPPINTNHQTPGSPEIKNNAGIMLNSHEPPSPATNGGWMITQ
ncbi:MAG: hypothetical protein LRY69_00215 [Gammaproteobacteria bacterium]|nr:hypothetical protein [Gammaproteobacteria bacterium]